MFDFPASPSEGQTYTPAGGPTWVYNSPAWKIAPATLAYLPLAGGTLTGDLAITKATAPTLTLNKTADVHNALRGSKNGLNRWLLALGNSTAESTADAGSDFALGRYADAGTFIDNVLSIARASATVAGAAIATVAEIRTAVAAKLLTVANLWSSAAGVAVAYAASLTLDLSTAININVSTVSGALTLNNPSGGVSGKSGLIRIIGDGTPRTINFGTAFMFPSGTKPTQTSGGQDSLWYQFVDGTFMYCSYTKNHTNA